MIGLAMAAAFTLGAGCDGGLCNGATLAPYFAKLAAGARAGRPVHILQIGDSHTAGDAITGAWRDALQARYGSGGRGVLPPGRPYDGYITHGVKVTMSPGWRIAADFGKAYGDPHPPLGLAAFSLTSEADGASMALEAEPAQRFSRVIVCAIARPGAGSLAIHVGAATETMALGSVSERPECKTIRAGAPETHVDLVASGGPVTITSWATFADAGGVALSNLGVVGSQLIHFSRTDDAVLAEELRAYDPDLIVIAFGTNEGFAPRFSSFEHETILRSQIGRIRRLAGNVPILLLGAPDALTRRPELKANAPGETVTPCPQDGAPPAIAAASPAERTGSFSGAMARLGAYLGMTSATEEGAAPPPGSQPLPSPPPAAAPTASPAGARGPLFPPAGLSAVRDSQRRVAASLHVAFWDWEARMGGRCTAVRWVRAAAPLMRGDYVHYTSAGGREIAQRLQADLDKAAR